MGPQFRHLRSRSIDLELGTSRLRVALVLDNTGSMADAGKMTALKTAAKEPHRPVEDRRGHQRRRLCVDHSVQQGRQCRRHVELGANWLNWKLWDPINAVYGP